MFAPLAMLLSLPACAQDPGSAEERALCGRAEHPPEATADLQPPWAGGTPAPGVLLHGRYRSASLVLKALDRDFWKVQRGCQRGLH